MSNGLKGIIRACKDEVGVYRAVMADPRCPRVSRWLLGAAIAYALSPVDLIPDFIPVLGQIDDLLAVPLLIWLALRAMPDELMSEYRSKREGRRNGDAPAEPTAVSGRPHVIGTSQR